ncbi:MAG: MaoC family dehydratase N-terminal domain-containing protein [Longimicrobiales bacterium]|nr:MaoC family dehydratase N-terminal domain-containing protein [Longimicrobiales bacterium]
MTAEPAGVEDAVGRQRTERDEATLFPARGMRALLDRDPAAVAPGDVLPWGWHWLYFKPVEPQAELGEDGHPQRGRFLPGGPLGRRMWAGGALRFFEPLRLGDGIERVSTVTSVTAKEGRSGKLVFVTIGHRVSGPRGLACDEDQHLVYRRPGDSVAPRVVPPEATPPEGEPEWEEAFLPTSTALFRFSALTFNPHRIHYDHPYATEREGYRGLVVHGPLLTLLLLDAGIRRTPGRTAGVFTYRAVAPAFADEMITLVGQTERSGAGVRLHALNRDGSVVTKANLEWRP